MGKYCMWEKNIILIWKEICLDMKGIVYRGKKDIKKILYDLDYELVM